MLKAKEKMIVPDEEEETTLHGTVNTRGGEDTRHKSRRSNRCYRGGH